MKTFEITLSIDCRLTLQIEAENELQAKLKSSAQIRGGEHTLEHYIREIELTDIEEIEEQQPHAEA
jgi:hypothetical protein